MKKVLLFTLFLSFSFPLAAQEASPDAGDPEEAPRSIDVDEARRAILEEDPAELTSVKIGDTDVSLEIHGFWNPALSLTWGITNSPFGPGVASLGSPFLFEQEVDLTLALWIRERWFVEANFQDDNPLNTYRAGYQGKDDEFVEYAGVGNTGLDFPVFPYLDMGGTTRSSFGFYGRFKTGPVKTHALVRYDAAVVEESVFSGGHERSYTYTALDAFQKGRYFRLPDTTIGALPIVYLEDDNGWREAKPSEASVSAFLGVVELAATPKGRVAVFYPGGYDEDGAFFDEVRAAFAPVDLDQYAPPGGFTASSYTATILGKPALVLYEKGYFSPFEEQNRYLSPVRDAEDAVVALSSTGTAAAGFALVEDEGVSGTEDVFRLVGSGVLAGDGRWPLLATDESYKLMYLGDTSSVSEDMRIRWTSLAAASGYTIGQDVLPGSIAVFRGGMRDMDFSFNASTGEVTLNNPAQGSETIRITYLRESAEKRFGSIAAGLGFVYETENPFSWMLGLGLRWNTAEDAFSEYGQSNAGRIGASAKLGWEGETVKAAVTLGAGYEENDTTGLYRAAGMEGNELVWMLPEGGGAGNENGAFQAHPPSALPALDRDNRADLVYRRYRSTNAVGIETLDDISRSHPIESGVDGPYVAADKALSGNALVAEAVLYATKTWAGYQVPLGSMKEAIAGARSIEIPFHLYGFDSGALDAFTVTAEFGPMPGENSSVGENKALIVRKTIYDSSTKLSNNCAIAEMLLSNDDRRKLQGATHFRLVIQRTAGTAVIDGRVLLAPLIIRGVKFAPIARNASDTAFDTDSFDKVTTVETVDSSLRQRYPSEIDRLHPQNAAQRVLNVRWDGLASGAKAGADGLVPRLPLENYRSLTFFLKAPDTLSGNGNFVFQAGGGRERFDDHALRAVIPLSALTADAWHKVTLYYGKGKRDILVDGNVVAGGGLQYREDGRQETFTYVAFYADTAGVSDSFSLDEICLEESIPGFWGNAGTTLAWEHSKPLLSAGGYTVVENPRFETSLESGGRGAALPDEQAQTEGAFASRSRAEITVLEAKLGGHFNYGASSGTDPVWSGGHSVERIFGPVSVREAFSLDPEDSAWDHTAALNIGGQTLPFSFDMRALKDKTRLRRSWNAGLGFHGGPRLLSLSLQTGLSAQWVYPASENAEPEDYGLAWTESWREMKPDTGADARERALKGNLAASLGGEALGVVFAFAPSQTERKLTDNANSATNTSLSFPWTAGSYSGSVTFARSWNSAILGAANDAGGDLVHYGESLERGRSHLLALPVYSLFAEETAVMPSGASGTAAAAPGESVLVSETFADSSAFLFTLPRRDDTASLFIPRSVETRLGRTVARRYDTLTDVFDLTVLTHFTAYNFFGAYGKLPVFHFYQSDEFNTLASYHLKLPKREEPVWDVTLDQDLWFFGFYGSSLSLGDTITVGSAGNIYAVTLSWTVMQQNNLPGKIYAAFIDRFAGNTLSPSLKFFATADRVFQRVEKLKYTRNTQGRKPVTTVSIGHESVVRIAGHLNFSLFATLDISDDQNTRITSVIASAGAKLRLNF